MLPWHHKLPVNQNLTVSFLVSYGDNKTLLLYKGKCELNLSMRSRTYGTRARVCGMSTRRGVRLDKLAALNLMSFIPAQSDDVDVAASTRVWNTRSVTRSESILRFSTPLREM